MTQFIVNYHIYRNDIRIDKSLIVSFNWYEWINLNRIIIRFYKKLEMEDYPVYYNDIDSINLILYGQKNI